MHDSLCQYTKKVEMLLKVHECKTDFTGFWWLLEKTYIPVYTCILIWFLPKVRRLLYFAGSLVCSHGRGQEGVGASPHRWLQAGANRGHRHRLHHCGTFRRTGNRESHLWSSVSAQNVLFLGCVCECVGAYMFVSLYHVNSIHVRICVQILMWYAHPARVCVSMSLYWNCIFVFYFQTINSLYDRTFPAEEYDNKDCEDNCTIFSHISSYILTLALLNIR